MRPVFEQAALFEEQVVEVPDVVAAEAAEEDQAVRALDYADGVNLHVAEFAHQFHNALGVRRGAWPGQALTGHGEAASCLRGD